jgi:hypothetical protein
LIQDKEKKEKEKEKKRALPTHSSSSLPSAQSLYPSHRQFSGMHLLLRHRNPSHDQFFSSTPPGQSGFPSHTQLY